jgi:DNA-binding IscR family transcriptional regulator
VGDILRITEGSIAPVDPTEIPSGETDLRVSNMVQDVWRGLEVVVSDYLDSLTLQDIIDSHKDSPGFDFCI